MTRAAASFVAAAVLLAAGCGPAPSPSPSPSPTPSSTPSPTPVGSVDPEAVYGLVASQVEQIRGLRPKSAVSPTLIDAATLRTNLTAEFDHQNPPATVQANELLLTTLGLLAPGTSLRDASLDLQSGEVIGYYSPDEKTLFLVSQSGGIGPTQRATYAHEFTHQLQDQNFDLKALGLDVVDQGDRSLARLALVEGDAVATQAAWMQADLTPQELAQVIADAADPGASAALARAPAVLRAELLFPYTDGFAFVTGLLGQGGYAAVNAAFARPPDSTEQVLHPDKYHAAEAPLQVTLPANLASRLGKGWTLLSQDTLGELLLRTWLTESGAATATATAAAAGWGGDRLALLGGPNGEVALAIVIRWDSQADANEFAHAAGTASSHLRGSSLVVLGDGARVLIAVGPSQSIAGRLATSLGF